MEMLDEAADYAEDNKGKVAAGIAAVILWFARGPILDAVATLLGEDNEEPGDGAGRSKDD
jgi:hypothetical protein